MRPRLTEALPQKQPAKRPMNVYHDESESEGWFAIGLLWVRPDDVAAVVRDLVAVRERTGYWHEVHFADLSDYARKRDTARDWFGLATRRHCPHCWFNVLAIDTTSRRYEGRRFDRDWRMYNRFTGMALWSGYRRFKFGPLELAYIADAKSRTPADNFEEYLEYRFWKDQVDAGELYEEEAFGLKFQLTNSEVKVRTVKVRTERRLGTVDADEELLQLCDLLLGATCQALTAASTSPTRKVKAGLGRKMMKVLRPRWGHEWFDHFTLSCFPDAQGGFYREHPFKMGQTRAAAQRQLGRWEG